MKVFIRIVFISKKQRIALAQRRRRQPRAERRRRASHNECFQKNEKRLSGKDSLFHKNLMRALPYRSEGNGSIHTQ